MRRQVKPYSQGSLDGLCGVHAIINALYVLFPDMKKKQAQKLFRTLIKEIVRKGALKVIWRGMDGALLRHLVLRAADVMAEHRSTSIKVSRPFASGPVELVQLVDYLKTRIDHATIAIAMVRKELWHWTVIVRATDKTLFLFDSDGLNSVRTNSCSLRKADGRHRINARELLLLRRPE